MTLFLSAEGSSALPGSRQVLPGDDTVGGVPQRAENVTWFLRMQKRK